jgi:hypothetical protein
VNQTRRIHALSVGHALDVNSAGSGVVHSVFAHAVNLMICGNMWTLLGEHKGDLPFGIRLPLSNLGTLGLRSGEPVSVRSGFVGVAASLVVDCRMAARWAPSREKKLEPGLERRLTFVATAAGRRSWHESGQMAQALRSAVNDPTTLCDALSKVVGRGPGATPSGDDVLVGVLAVLTSPHSGAAGAKAADSFGRSIIPLLRTTTDVSGQLLRQAAEGLFCRDLHELVSALTGTPSPQEFSEKVLRVVENGATSGADTCEGLLAFAPSFFTSHRRASE